MNIKIPSVDLKNFPLVGELKRQLRYKMFLFLAQYPKLYIPYTLWRDDLIVRGKVGGKLVKHNTEIIIDGFPRSANSFAVVAFCMAQKKKITVANHRHDPAQVIAAINKNIPALILLRNPKDAVISLIIRSQNINITPDYICKLLEKYLYFYKPLIPYQDNLVIASFETVVSNFDVVIDRVNSQFNVNYEFFNHNQENVNECFELISNYYKANIPLKLEEAVSIPSPYRDNIKKKLQYLFQDSKVQLFYNEAYQMYTLFKLVSV